MIGVLPGERVTSKRPRFACYWKHLHLDFLPG